MKMRIFLPIFVLIVQVAVGQERIQLVGQVTDQETNEPLIGVNVLVKNTFIGAATDSKGEFMISELSVQDYILVFSMIGYKTATVRISPLKNSQFMNVALEQDVLSSPQVIVTASRKAQDIMDAPLSVSVISPRSIRAKSATSLTEVLPYEAGVNTVNGQLNIRGASGYTMGAGERSLILLDGVPLLGSAAGNISWTVVPTSEIEQVEIIKSGGSALYGSSALGGVLNIITRNAPSKPETKLRTKLGRYSQPKYDQWEWRDSPGQYQLFEVTHARPFGNHSGWVRLQRIADDGFTELGWEDSWNITGKWKWNYLSQYTASLYGNYYTDTSGLINQWKSPADPFEAPEGDGEDYGVGSKLNINGFFNYVSSPNLSVKLKGSLYDVHWKNHGRTNQNYSNEQKIFSEIQLNSNLLSSLNVTTGLTAQHGLIDAEIFGNHTSMSAAFYLLVQQRVFSKWTVSAGGRFESYRVDEKLLDETFAPQIAVNYRPMDWMAIRSSFSRGFRVPTIAELFTESQMGVFVVKPNPNLIPEYSMSGELGGTIMMPLGRWAPHFIIDGAIFFNEYSNLIEPKPDDNGVIHFENVTNATISGTEIGVKLGVFDNLLEFGGAYTYLDPVEINASGSVIDTLSYRFRHTWVQSIIVNAFGFSTGIEYRYSSRMDKVQLFDENEITGSDKRVPVHVWNAQCGYQYLGWEVQLRVENIFQYYYTELERNMGSERFISLDIRKIF